MADNWSIEADERKKAGDIYVKVHVDVEDALKGLKAIQREVRKATQALKALEEARQQALKEIADGLWRKARDQ